MIQTRFLLTGAVLAAAALAPADIFVYTGSFSGLNESPPNASPGTGFTTVTIDSSLFTMRTQAEFSGLLGNTTAAHIHVRPDAGTPNGGVATMLPSFAGFPLGVTSGVFDNTFDMTQASSWNPSYINANGGTVSTAFTAFLNALNNDLAYFNIHSSTNPGGEVRANLHLVPEPGTLLIASIGIAALVRKKRAIR